MHKNLCISFCRLIFASEEETNNKLNPKTRKGRETMKTTKFFSEIKKVAKDSTLESMFDYSVNQDERFYEIFLHSEPTKKVQDMCAKNGFSIKENIMHVNEGDEMVAHTIWEVRPINTEDIEIASEELLKNVNEEVIIASDQAMIDAGLIKCNPRAGQLTLWAYMLNHVWNEWQWAPIMRVFAEPLKEDIKDEDGNVIEPKSTHRIDTFYGAPIIGNLDLTRFLKNLNVNVEKL